jgi:zinc metalloprotease ZmpA
VVAGTLTTLPPSAAAAVTPAARAASSADALVAGRPAALRAGADDAFVRRPAYSSAGWQYVPYERTYRTKECGQIPRCGVRL